MKTKRLTRTVNDRLVSQSEDPAANDNIGDIDLQKASADFYERRSRMWSRFARTDIMIAIGLYLLLASAAVVIM